MQKKDVDRDVCTGQKEGGRDRKGKIPLRTKGAMVLWETGNFRIVYEKKKRGPWELWEGGGGGRWGIGWEGGLF